MRRERAGEQAQTRRRSGSLRVPSARHRCAGEVKDASATSRPSDQQHVRDRPARPGRRGKVASDRLRGVAHSMLGLGRPASSTQWNPTSRNRSRLVGEDRLEQTPHRGTCAASLWPRRRAAGDRLGQVHLDACRGASRTLAGVALARCCGRRPSRPAPRCASGSPARARRRCGRSGLATLGVDLLVQTELLEQVVGKRAEGRVLRMAQADLELGPGEVIERADLLGIALGTTSTMSFSEMIARPRTTAGPGHERESQEK